jgi:hypothetical protein
LTGPGGEPVHINVEQITSVKSDTEVSGARTQLDLASGKFQRVKENVEQVMQLISATSDARENEETPSEGLICVGSIDRPSHPGPDCRISNCEDQQRHLSAFHGPLPESASGSMLFSNSASSDLTTAIVPAGTSFPAVAGAPYLLMRGTP